MVYVQCRYFLLFKIYFLKIFLNDLQHTWTCTIYIKETYQCFSRPYRNQGMHYITTLILVVIVYFMNKCKHLETRFVRENKGKLQQERKLRNMLFRQISELIKVIGQQDCNMLELKERLQSKGKRVVHISKNRFMCL